MSLADLELLLPIRDRQSTSLPILCNRTPRGQFMPRFRTREDSVLLGFGVIDMGQGDTVPSFDVG